MESVSGISASEAGTKNPTWARYIARAICFMYTVFPDAFGPVRMEHLFEYPVCIRFFSLLQTLALGACDCGNATPWFRMTSPASRGCQEWARMSAYDENLGLVMLRLTWLTPQKHYISQSCQ